MWLNSVLFCSGADSLKKIPPLATTLGVFPSFLPSCKNGGILEEEREEGGWDLQSSMLFVNVRARQEPPGAAVHCKITARPGSGDLNGNSAHTELPPGKTMAPQVRQQSA